MKDPKVLNKLIAEFMGVKPVDNWFDGFELYKAGLPFAYGTMGNGTDELKFKSSWDWLMPVIEKIDSTILETDVISIEHNITYIENYKYEMTITGEGKNRLEACYNAVCEYITWHNEKSKS